MKKFGSIFIILCVATLAFAEGPKSLVSGNLGVNFFNYKTVYLTTGITYQTQVRPGMDVVGGADFGIHTEQTASGATQADFLIPLKIGLNFPFETPKAIYGLGTGIRPCFQSTSDTNAPSFLMGPYINGTVRFQVHPVMSLIFQFQQDLLFGKPDWIYTATSISAGIAF